MAKSRLKALRGILFPAMFALFGWPSAALAGTVPTVGERALAQAPGEGEDECPTGTILVIVRGIVDRAYCVSPGDPPIATPIVPPGLPGETPPPPPLEYHAGVCAAPLHNLPAAIGPIRHDDVHSYASETFVSDAGIVVRRLSERTAGFFPVDQDAATEAALTYLGLGILHYVPGLVRHSLRTECTMATVGESKYDRVRAEVDALGWTTYHFFRKNCQHWASKVWGA